VRWSRQKKRKIFFNNGDKLQILSLRIVFYHGWTMVNLHKENNEGSKGSKFKTFFSVDADENEFRGSNSLFTFEIYGFSDWTGLDHLLEVSQEIN
jgi:hypothetical protein